MGVDLQPQRIKLNVGIVTLEFHLGNLRYIKVGEQEIIRSIYFAVRDENWGTLPCTISSVDLKENANGFELSFIAEFGDPLIFKACCSIDGKRSGNVTFAFDGEVQIDFKRNRIGFCVLHPIKECAGKCCTIIHADNSVSETRFPELISPHQPFKSISAMQWEVEGASAKLSFEGDVFETEDQRNWTDASFKTYCTPLELPFPVLVKAGERIAQKIVLDISAPLVDPSSDKPKDLFVIDYAKEKRLSALGSVYRYQPLGLTEFEIEKLKEASLDHLRYDVKFNSSTWIIELQQLIHDAEKLKCKIELCLHFDQRFEESINRLLWVLKQKSIEVAYLSILSTTDRATRNEHLTIIAPLLRKAFPHALIGAGTDYDFTDLNRSPVDLSNIDYVFYSACPQVHAFDDLSLIENTEGLAETVKSAKTLALGKRVHVSAISLKRRSNPDATSSFSDPKQQFLQTIDHRQYEPFGALWTAGALKNAWEQGADLVTLFETTGPRGFIMEDATQEFATTHHLGNISPIYDLLKTIARFKPIEIVETKAPKPLEVDGMLLRNFATELLVVFNYTNELKHITLEQKWKIAEPHGLSIDRAGNQPSTLSIPPMSISYFERSAKMML